MRRRFVWFAPIAAALMLSSVSRGETPLEDSPALDLPGEVVEVEIGPDGDETDGAIVDDSAEEGEDLSPSDLDELLEDATTAEMAESSEAGEPEPLPVDPDNPGQAALDRALEVKLTANDLKDLNEVVDLIDEALDQGLDAENTEFAEQVLVATLMQRAASMSRAVLGRPVADPRTDPRWLHVRHLALTDLQRVVGVDDSQVEAWMLIGRLQSLPMGSVSEARRALTKVIRAAERAEEDPALDAIEPKTLAQAHALRGRTQKESADRLSDFGRAVELQPDTPEFLLLRAKLHQAEQRPEECLADIERAIELSPDNAAAHELKALALLMQEQPEAALESFNRATELAPQALKPYLYRGEVFSQMGKLDDAVAQLDKALELAPNNVAALLIRAELLMLAEEPARALADIEAAIRQQPAQVPPHLMRARALKALGRDDEAAASLERLADAAPGRADVRLQLAAFYVESQKPVEAIGVLNEVLAIDAENELALRWRGDMRLLVGEHADAVVDFAAAMENNPLDAGVLNNLAWTLATSPFDEVRDGERAVELALKACEVTDYAEAHILSTLAAAYAESGDFESAIRWSREAIDKASELGDLDRYDGQLEAELASYEAEQPWRELQQAGDADVEADAELADEAAEVEAPADAAEAEEPDAAPAGSFDF